MRISDWSSDVCSSDLRRMFPNKLISPLVPFAAGIIGTQYSRSFLSFFGNAQREITFGQPHQRLWRMRRRLIFVDHLAEAQSGSDERRLGKDGVSTCQYRLLLYPSNKN